MIHPRTDPWLHVFEEVNHRVRKRFEGAFASTMHAPCRGPLRQTRSGKAAGGDDRRSDHDQGNHSFANARHNSIYHIDLARTGSIPPIGTASDRHDRHGPENPPEALQDLLKFDPSDCTNNQRFATRRVRLSPSSVRDSSPPLSSSRGLKDKGGLGSSPLRPPAPACSGTIGASGRPAISRC